MNYLMADVTDIPHVSEWDQVILIGKMQDNEISVDEWAKLSHTINLEILTTIQAKKSYHF